MIYAQAEYDFGRVQRTSLNGLGLLAQAEGEPAVYSDLRQRLFIDPIRLQAKYRASPAWLKALMEAWSDGLNYFLSKHPAVAPKVIRHFEPWMALSFTEGSIGGDIESIDLGKLREFYGTPSQPPARTVNSRAAAVNSQVVAVPAPVGPAPPARAASAAEPVPGGSNGFAIWPRRSASRHAPLWTDPPPSS